jgi:hypothetical protein
MAKLALRSVNGPSPLPRSEEEFLSGAPIALPETRNPTAPDETRNPTAPPDETRNPTAPDETRNSTVLDAEGPDDGLIAVTIRIPRRLKDALEKRAADDDRSVSQITRRLLAPLLG